jgi:conjugal transfer pilus assembly protein TrbC
MKKEVDPMLTLIRVLLPVCFVALAILVNLVQVAHAQTRVPAMRMPTEKDLDSARAVLPGQDDVQGAMAARRQAGMPKVPLVPPSGASAPIDAVELAAQYERVQARQRGEVTGDQEAQERTASGPLMFVSLSMPRASLERILVDAEKLKAPMVLRGVKGSSMRKTAAEIKEILGKHRVAWSIDPSLFKRFGVEGVPTLVLIDPTRPVMVACGAAHCQSPAFSKVSGDVTMRYALEQIQQRDPEFEQLAKRYVVALERPR